MSRDAVENLAYKLLVRAVPVLLSIPYGLWIAYLVVYRFVYHTLYQCFARFRQNSTAYETLSRLPRAKLELAQDPYEYSPLPGKRYFRILQLKNSSSVGFDDVLECDLITVSLDKPVLSFTYRAISYTWDNQKFDRYILCSGEKLAITQNCEDVLRHMLVRQRLYVWIDALCINQSSKEEKATQIPLMARGHTPYILDILRRNWWRRVWTIQETALAPISRWYSPCPVLVNCGRFEMPLDTLSFALMDFSLFHDTYGGGAYPLNHTVWVHCLTSHSGKRMYISRPDGMILLDHLMFFSRACHAWDPRDRVYGLYGVIQQFGIKLSKPSSSKTKDEVYWDFTREACHSTHSLSLFNLARGTESGLKAPSWVPDYSAPFRMGEMWGNTKASGDSTPHFRFSADGRIIHTRGVLVDVIMTRSTGAVWKSSPDSILNQDGDFVNLEEGYEQTIATYREWYSVFKVHISCLLRRYGNISSSISAFGAVLTFGMLSASNYEALVGWISIVDEGEDRRSEVLERARRDPKIRANFSKTEARRRVMENEAWQTLCALKTEPGVATLNHFIWMLATDKSVFVTESGFMGSGTRSIMEGDVIVLLTGVDRPMVLRETSDKSWVVPGKRKPASDNTASVMELETEVLVVKKEGTTDALPATHHYQQHREICRAVVYLFQKVFLRTSRLLRRLELESKSAVLNNSLETVEDLLKIRMFGDHGKHWPNLVFDRLVAGVAVSVTALAVAFKDTTTSWTNRDISLGGIARLKTMEAGLPDEDKAQENNVPPEPWPSSGVIEIRNLTAADNAEAIALRNVSLRDSAWLETPCMRPNREVSPVTNPARSHVLAKSPLGQELSTASIPTAIGLETRPNQYRRQRSESNPAVRRTITLLRDGASGATTLRPGSPTLQPRPSKAQSNDTILDVLDKVHMRRYFSRPHCHYDFAASDGWRCGAREPPSSPWQQACLAPAAVGAPGAARSPRACPATSPRRERVRARPLVLLDEAMVSLGEETEALIPDIAHKEPLS
ncbi:hypothetical protein DL768_001127 [Monosporascus sp. mg162]|nr:hypothetical protein DL768_001127 [Monosporascus sp. mg162]